MANQEDSRAGQSAKSEVRALDQQPLTLLADTVLTPSDTLTPGWVTVEGGYIRGLGPGRRCTGGRLIDLADRIIAPGFVDVHVHGGDGAQVNGETAAEVAVAVRQVAACHVKHGTTSLLATTVSDGRQQLTETLRGIGHCTREGPAGGARVLGAHLEGPWLAAERAGAHDAARVHPPDPEEVEAFLDADPGVLRLVTLAPELAGGLAVVRRLAASGVVVAVGHTAADYDQTRQAFDAGASHVTHLFNAMAGIEHRSPGPVVAALTDSRVTVEVIADGVHLDPAVLRLVSVAASGRMVAVTDAMAATGLAPGRHELGRMGVDVVGKRVVLSDRPEALAGSVLTMDRAVAALVAAGVSLSDAVIAATLTPARAIGDRARGRIDVGYPADLVVLARDLTCAATLVDGAVVHDPLGLFADDDQSRRSTNTPQPR